MPVDRNIITEIIQNIHHIPNTVFKGISENKADNKLLAAYSRLIDLYNNFSIYNFFYISYRG